MRLDEVNEPLSNSSLANRVRSMKLDFGPPIATFPVVCRTPSLPSSDRSFRIDRMAPSFPDIVEEARLSARALLDYGDTSSTRRCGSASPACRAPARPCSSPRWSTASPRGGRFPVFEPFATGRIARARLEPQPDDAVPRFDYENHVRTLIEERRWPNSTVDISELRLVIDYQRHNGADRTLTLDIVDYPGEWLLDLPLLDKSYEQWSAESLALSRQGPRAQLAAPWHAHLATLEAEGARGRAGGADRGAAVHRLSARLPRRALRHEPAAARPLPDAGQSRGLAGADLCAARCAGRRHRARRLAVGDDGAALRGLQGRRGAAVLPRSFRAARSPDRAGRRARRLQRRAGGAARSRGGAGRHPRLLPHRPQHAARARCSGRASTASCSRRPRPTICISRATTGWKRSCGARSTRAAARAEFAGAAIDVVALAAVRATREAQVAARPRQAALDPRHAGGRRKRRRRDVRRRDRGRDLSGRPAGRSRGAVQRRRCVSRPLQRAGRKDRFPLPALPAAAARTRRQRTSPRCLTSASTAPSSS